MAAADDWMNINLTKLNSLVRCPTYKFKNWQIFFSGGNLTLSCKFEEQWVVENNLSNSEFSYFNVLRNWAEDCEKLSVTGDFNSCFLPSKINTLMLWHGISMRSNKISVISAMLKYSLLSNCQPQAFKSVLQNFVWCIIIFIQKSWLKDYAKANIVESKICGQF